MSLSVGNVVQIPRSDLFSWLRPTQTCVSKECTRTYNFWRRIVDRTQELRFRGASLCFPGCFERELHRCLGLLSTSTSSSAFSRPRRIPIGLLMLSRGTLTKEQLRRALEEQKQRGAGQIGEWLRHLGFARERDIAAALAMQWSCPLIQALPAVTHSFGLPIHLLQSCRIAPVHFSQATGTLHVAFAEQIAYPVLFSIEQMLEVRTEACLTTPRELDAALTRIQESKPREEKLFEHPSGLDEIVRIVSGYAAKLRAIEARVVGYGNYFWVRILGGAETVNLIFATERYAGRSAQEDQPLRPLSPTEKFA